MASDTLHISAVKGYGENENSLNQSLAIISYQVVPGSPIREAGFRLEVSD